MLQRVISGVRRTSVTCHFAAVIATQPARYLRKDQKHVQLEGGQKWMFKVLERAKQPVCQDSLQQMARRLQYLEKKGCKAYQMMEYPEALTLSDEQIVERVNILEKQGVVNISIPLLKMAKGQPKTISQRINRFLARRKGFESSADLIKAKLDCTEPELMELIGKNPRILNNSCVLTLEDKINTLLEHGASIKHIRRHSAVLKNCSLEIIKKRASELADMGCNNPLPLKWIMSAEHVYIKIVQNYKEHEQRNEFVHKVLKDNLDLSARLPFLKQRFRTLMPKIDFLESKGFHAEDIITQRILHLGLNTIRDTYAILEEHGIEDISIPILYHFAVFKRIRSKPHVRLNLSKIMNIKEEPVPQKMVKLLFLQQRHVLIENYKFLIECGFTKDSIQRLIIIIGHSPRIIRRHWDLLPEREELWPFESWQQDDWRLLNVLQYYIEKENNFQQPVVLEDYQ